MRRSTREPKKPDVFSFVDSQGNEQVMTDDEETYDSSQSVEVAANQQKKKAFAIFNGANQRPEKGNSENLIGM